MPPVMRSKSARSTKPPIPPWTPGQPVPDPMVIAEAARYLRLPISSVYGRTCPGAVDPIPHIRVGRLVRFRQRDLDGWLAARNTAVPPKKGGAR